MLGQPLTHYGAMHERLL